MSQRAAQHSNLSRPAISLSISARAPRRPNLTIPPSSHPPRAAWAPLKLHLIHTLPHTHASPRILPTPGDLHNVRDSFFFFSLLSFFTYSPLCRATARSPPLAGPCVGYSPHGGEEGSAALKFIHTRQRKCKTHEQTPDHELRRKLPRWGRTKEDSEGRMPIAMSTGPPPTRRNPLLVAKYLQMGHRAFKSSSQVTLQCCFFLIL